MTNGSLSYYNMFQGYEFPRFVLPMNEDYLQILNKLFVCFDIYQIQFILPNSHFNKQNVKMNWLPKSDIRLLHRSIKTDSFRIIDIYISPWSDKAHISHIQGIVYTYVNEELNNSVALRMQYWGRSRVAVSLAIYVPSFCNPSSVGYVHLLWTFHTDFTRIIGLHTHYIKHGLKI